MNKKVSKIAFYIAYSVFCLSLIAVILLVNINGYKKTSQAQIATVDEIIKNTSTNYVEQKSGYVFDSFELIGVCEIPTKTISVDKNFTIMANIGDFVLKDKIVAKGETEQTLSFNGLFFNTIPQTNETQLVFYDYDSVIVNVSCHVKYYADFVKSVESDRLIVCLDNKNIALSFESAVYNGGEFYNIRLKVTSISPELINGKSLNVCFMYNVVAGDFILPLGSLVYENNAYFINVYDDKFNITKQPVKILYQNDFLASIEFENFQPANLKIAYDIEKTTIAQLNAYYRGAK